MNMVNDAKALFVTAAFCYLIIGILRLYVCWARKSNFRNRVGLLRKVVMPLQFGFLALGTATLLSAYLVQAGALQMAQGSAAFNRLWETRFGDPGYCLQDWAYCLYLLLGVPHLVGAVWVIYRDPETLTKRWLPLWIVVSGLFIGALIFGKIIS